MTILLTLKGHHRATEKNLSLTSLLHLLNLNSGLWQRRASLSSILLFVSAALAESMKITIAATNIGLAPRSTLKPASPDSSMKTSMMALVSWVVLPPAGGMPLDDSSTPSCQHALCQ